MPRPRLYFITGNSGKFREVVEIIPGLERLDLPLDEIQSLDARHVIEHKLEQAALLQAGAFVVEDTSVVFKCLGDKLPGTMIKWFYDELGNDGLVQLVHNYNDHSAVARTTFGYRDSAGTTTYFSGEVEGTIVAPRGDVESFGFNSIFLPIGNNKTFAEMTITEKNEISMRGIAARKLGAYLIDHDV